MTLTPKAEIELCREVDWHEGVVTWSTQEAMGIRFDKKSSLREMQGIVEQAVA